MRPVHLACFLAAAAPTAVSAASLTLVTNSAGSLNEIGVNADANPFLRDEDIRLDRDRDFTTGPDRIDTAASHETPHIDEEGERPVEVEATGPFAPYRLGRGVGYADATVGKTGMRVDASSEATGDAFISRADTGLAFGFLYEGDDDLVLPTGWFSLTVDGTWGGSSFDYRVSSNAGFLATVTTGSPYRIDPEIGAVSGPRVDAVSGRANAMFGAFFADAFTDLDAAEGSSVFADDDGFSATLLADGMTVKDGQFLSFSFGHNVSAGVEGTEAFVDSLSTASIGLNVRGLAEVDTGDLGAVSWINDAPAPPDTPAVPLPAAGWMLLAGLGGIAALRCRPGFG